MAAVSEAALAMESNYERQLVARCRDGDHAAFEQIFTKFENTVLTFAYHMLGDWDDACDVRQETFLNAFQAISGFRGQCSLKSWLLTICANLCRRSRAARSRQTFLLRSHVAGLRGEPSFLLGSAWQCDPFEAVARSQTIETIVLALGSLPPAQREALILREVYGMENREIGQILGRTRGSISILLFRARRRFAERAEALLKEKE